MKWTKVKKYFLTFEMSATLSLPKKGAASSRGGGALPISSTFVGQTSNLLTLYLAEKMCANVFIFFLSLLCN